MTLPAFTFEKLSTSAPRASTPRAPESTVEATKPRGKLRRMLDRFTARGRATARRTEASKQKQNAQR
jgi:hypothetical protein